MSSLEATFVRFGPLSREPKSDSSLAPSYTPTKYQQDVSTATVQEWEKELMEDPKVPRHAYSHRKILTSS